MQNKKTEYYSTGEIRSEAYCSTLSNNLIHRNDGPAWILYNKNKNIVEKEYF